MTSSERLYFSLQVATSSTPIEERGPTEENLLPPTIGEAPSISARPRSPTSAVRSRKESEESMDSGGMTSVLCFFDLTLPPMEEESGARFDLGFILGVEETRKKS
ncbi:hypothetical protein HID58_055534 [Brassica napus]|uniref:Uncharacterized protein n=1 Tax=Brassica napus TaxID=3708 RepID=A0ABQ8AKS2_BRANA|nr:hypothetical protein HID58_055534 [Brassica napus]